MLIALLKKWEMAAATTNRRLKGTCIAWVHKYDITFPVQLQTSQYYQLLWSGKKGIFVCFVLIFSGVYRRCLLGFGQRPNLYYGFCIFAESFKIG